MVFLLGLILAASAVAASAQNSPVALRRYEVHNDIPPRLQWNENSGYCGEVCFISAGLYYGQYLSQYDARAAIGSNIKQNQVQILLGDNDQTAAAHMHLHVEEWNPRGQSHSPQQFLTWVKRQVLLGRPVAIGLYNNESTFQDAHWPGDPTYDHIVSVVGISSRHPLSTGRAYLDDTILFSDNGLLGTSSHRPYFFRYAFGTFSGDRTAANFINSPTYTLPDKVPNYGIAFSGVVDPKHETLPVRLKTNVNYESPQIGHHSNAEPPGRPIVLTITVSDLKPGVNYNLYRYDNLESVPDSDFNAHAAQAVQTRAIKIASGSTYTFKLTINSNDIAVFRAVRAD
jgi:hypothetical protein